MNENIYKDAQKVNLITLLRTFKKEGIENFIVTRRNKFENLLKEIQELKEDNQHQWDERCKLTFKIEKKDKEIQELKESDKRSSELMANFSERHFHDRQKIQELKADRVEKDKIIKLMTKYINSTDKVEYVCRETGDTYNCTEYRNCEECIIEFFKKKAREENE